MISQNDHYFGKYKIIPSDPDNMIHENVNVQLFPEKPVFVPSDPDSPIFDETSQQKAEFDDEMTNKYYEAKWNWYVDKKMSQLREFNSTLVNILNHLKKEERGIKDKLEFMYNKFDYFNDRRRVRDKLAHYMHKKASLKDIGEILDKMIIEEEQATGFKDNISPKSLNQEYHIYDLFDSVKEITHAKKIKPSIFEDRDNVEKEYDLKNNIEVHDIIGRVDANDINRDNSIEGLNENEKMELEVFKSIKKDPYYKHYIHNCFRYESEYFNSKIDDLSKTIATDIRESYHKRIKFDKIEIPKYPSLGVENSFVGRVTAEGKAWGSGRRKTAKAIACVFPGSGKVRINKKNIIDYFRGPYQRKAALKPIDFAGYASMLDVELYIKGGGYSAQVQACVSALSKAICRFDPELYEVMKAAKLYNSDGRVKERKRYGFKKARKGRVYRRR